MPTREKDYEIYKRENVNRKHFLPFAKARWTPERMAAHIFAKPASDFCPLRVSRYMMATLFSQNIQHVTKMLPFVCIIKL